MRKSLCHWHPRDAARRLGDVGRVRVVRRGSCEAHSVTRGTRFLLMGLHVSQPPTTGRVLVIRPASGAGSVSGNQKTVMFPGGLKVF